MAENKSPQKATSTVNKSLQSSVPARNKFPKIRLSQGKLLKKQKQTKAKLVCDKCEARFENWWEKRDHWEASGHKTPEFCTWCNKKTYTLQSHICKHHWGEASMCPNCGEMFMFQEDMNKHLLQHDNSVYRCSHCGRRRKNEELLRKHVQNHFLYEKYGCNVCEKRFKKKKNLEQHLTKIHLICQYCGGTSDNVANLKKHLKIHDDFKCLLCKKVFSQKNRLKYHYQLIHGHQDFYNCSQCFQRFAKKSVLISHIKLKHHGKSKFSCKICALPFLYWQQYRNHFDTIHLKKPMNKFDCSFCEFSTDIKFKLKCHVEKSSGLGFFCKKCQLSFECKGRFDQHMKTHADESMWSCDHCERTFKSDNTLRHHMIMYHQKESLAQNARVYPCLEKGCQSFYVSKSSLARHIRRTHSGAVKTSTITCDTSCLSEIVLNEEKLDTISDVEDKEQKDVENKEQKNFEDEEQKFVEDNKQKDVKDIKDTDQDEQSILNQSNENDPSDSDHSYKTVEKSLTEKLDGYHKLKMPLGIINEVDKVDKVEVTVFNCDICQKLWFDGESLFKRHMRSHTKVVWDEKCVSCSITLETPEEAVKHYVEEHFKVKFIN